MCFTFYKNQKTAFINSDQSQQPNSDWPMPVRMKSLNATNAFFLLKEENSKRTMDKILLVLFFVITF